VHGATTVEARDTHTDQGCVRQIMGLIFDGRPSTI
jgi:hypothetical protein